MPVSARSDEWWGLHEIDAEVRHDDGRGSAGDLLYDLGLRLTAPELCRLRADPGVWPALARAIGAVRLPRVLERITASERRLAEDPAVFRATECLKGELGERIREVVAAAVGGEVLSRVPMNVGLASAVLLEASTVDAVGLARRDVAVELCQGPFEMRLTASGVGRVAVTVSGHAVGRVRGVEVCPTWSEAWQLQLELALSADHPTGAPGEVRWF